VLAHIYYLPEVNTFAVVYRNHSSSIFSQLPTTAEWTQPVWNEKFV